MKIVCISDTHGQYRNVKLPKGDVLIHAGDWDAHNSHARVIDFARWLDDLDFKHKIVIAGNHELLAEYNNGLVKMELKNVCTYLENESVMIDGLKFYGSPYTPEFNDWAFNKKPGPELQRIWKMIPFDTNVLITHGPPQFVLDQIEGKGWNLGCRDLAARIKQLKHLRLHVFGHIHTGHGVMEDNKEEFNMVDGEAIKKVGLLYVNASLLNEQYDLEYQGITVEL